MTIPDDPVGRGAWAVARRRMEQGREKHSPVRQRRRRKQHWDPFVHLLRLAEMGLRLIGLHRRGVRNALGFAVNRMELSFADLPPAFDGFRLLQISDPHFDALPGIEERLCDMAAAEAVDLCVLTGDYLLKNGGPFAQVLPSFARLAAAVKAGHGIVAILGNHDPADLVPGIEAAGIRVLINESLTIERDGDAIHLTGTDDVHYFYTDAVPAALGAAPAALGAAPDGFRIALIHSVEAAGIAADAGFQLYLAGHTHGGQICLPGGRPVFTHLTCHRAYARGIWRHGDMVGYTSSGVGVSGIPVRFNCPGEMAVITLRRAPIQSARSSQ